MSKVSKRQQAILDLIGEQGFVATDTLVRRFGVTPQTIRRDLNALSESHRIARFHGGAGGPSLHTPYRDRRQSGVAAKRSIADATAKLIPDGASLFINIGTTTEAVAEALLDHRDLFVITNNLNVARTLSANESFTIKLSGGEVRHHDGGLVGSEAVDFIDGHRADFGIIGISAVDVDGSLLEFDAREARPARAIVRNSARVILVTEHHKFGRRATNRMGSLRELDTVVTDSAVGGVFPQLLEDGGVELIVASSGKASASKGS